MTGTPARDANRLRLEDFVLRALVWDPDELDEGTRRILRERVASHVSAVLTRPSLVIAALVEAGWRPSDEELRAMGGEVLPWETASHQFAGTALWRFPRPEEDPEHG